MSDPTASSDTAHDHFPPTRWTLVLEAQDADPAALARLCGDYWQPLYGYACRLSGDPDTAKDLTQGFFEHLLSKESLRHARRDRGRLRSFLLTSLKSYSISLWRKSQRQQRGSGHLPISLNALDAAALQHLEPRHHLTPELEFDRAWARQLLTTVLLKLESHYTAANKAPLFHALKDRLESKHDIAHYPAIATQLGISQGSLRLHVFKLRQRYRHLLQQAIAQTVASPEDLADEIQYLRSVFAPPS